MCRDDTGDEVGDGAADHAGLAERGEHLIDVMQEACARADDQDAGIGESATVRIQQICGAMQRDSGFAGSRSALNNDHTVERRADDAILFRLNGGDDIGHLAGTLRVERRE